MAHYLSQDKVQAPRTDTCSSLWFCLSLPFQPLLQWTAPTPHLPDPTTNLLATPDSTLQLPIQITKGGPLSTTATLAWNPFSLPHLAKASRAFEIQLNVHFPDSPEREHFSLTPVHTGSNDHTLSSSLTWAPSPSIALCILRGWDLVSTPPSPGVWQTVRASYVFAVEEKCLSDHLIFDYRAHTLTQKLSSKMYKLKHETSHQDVSQEWLGQSGWLAGKVFNKNPS